MTGKVLPLSRGLELRRAREVKSEGLHLSVDPERGLVFTAHDGRGGVLGEWTEADLGAAVVLLRENLDRVRELELKRDLAAKQAEAERARRGMCRHVRFRVETTTRPRTCLDCGAPIGPVRAKGTRPLRGKGR